MSELHAPPFIVLSLPRSRSAWMAHWLSYPGKLVGHDIAIKSKSVADFLAHFAFADGTVETSAMLGWRLLKHELPNLKTLVVIRDPKEVIESLAKKGLSSNELANEVLSRWHMLQAIGSAKDAKAVRFGELDNKEIRGMIFEWLLELGFDEDWDARFAYTNIQVDFVARVEQLARNKDQISAFRVEVLARQQVIGMKSCPIFN
jgi:hypothetical protein